MIQGSIPAHTGKPTHGPRNRHDSKGLSPHTRGNLHTVPGTGMIQGSIPAHTGKPADSLHRKSTLEVYPRTHGETSRNPAGTTGERGLSPHTRGNRRRQTLVTLRSRGLSPHTRGNPVALSCPWALERSIPAHTGKPRPPSSCRRCPGVYPRTHGETVDLIAEGNHGLGLSPHTRGNHGDQRGSGHCVWWVYPRTHGETPVFIVSGSEVEGLSPHTRGNQSPNAPGPIFSGSIPAHTGKPVTSFSTSFNVKVYPRTHGETITVTLSPVPAQGLSPHTRGNHQHTVLPVL